MKLILLFAPVIFFSCSLKSLDLNKKEKSLKSIDFNIEKLKRFQENGHHDSVIRLGFNVYQTAKNQKYFEAVTKLALILNTSMKNSFKGDEAMAILLDAIRINEIDTSKNNYFSLLNGLSVLYTNIGLDNDAKEILIKLKNERSKSGYAQNAKEISNLGECYNRIKNFDSALYYQNLAISISNKEGNLRALGLALNNKGSILFKQGKIENAIESYSESISLSSKEQNRERLLANSYVGLSECFLLKKELDSCKKYLTIAEKLITTTNNNIEKPNLYTVQIKLAEAFNNYKDQVYYQKLLIESKDEKYKSRVAQQIEQQKNEESIRLAKLELEKNIAIENRSNMLQSLGIALFIIVLILLSIFLQKSSKKSVWVPYLNSAASTIGFTFLAFLISPFISNLTNEKPIYVVSASIFSSLLFNPIKKYSDLKLKSFNKMGKMFK